MNIGNALVNSLIVSGLILVAAMIFGIKGEKKPAATRRASRRTKRRASPEIHPAAEARAGVGGGR